MFGRLQPIVGLVWPAKRNFAPIVIEIAGACLILLVSSLIQIQYAQSAQSKPTQAIVLSDAQSAPDTKAPPPSAQPPSQPRLQSVPIAAPWQGPVVPIPSSPVGGLAPVFSRLPISEPVVFLGIDDGWFQSPENQQWLKAHHLPFTLFLVDSQIKNDYVYFKQLQSAGMTVEDHSVTHPDFTKLDLPTQQAQICGDADSFAPVFGRRPNLFRPPYGDYNALTQQAAAACGIKAIIMWNVVLQDGSFQFQPPMTRLEPGDIILAHFQSDLIPNMQALNAELERDHLQLGRLEDWLY